MNHKNSSRHRLKLKKVGYIIIIWMLLSIFQVFYDYMVVINFTKNPELFRFWSIFMANTAIAVVGGGLSGFLIINKVERWLRKFPFVQVIIWLILLYTFFGLLLIATGSFIYQSYILNTSLINQAVLNEVWYFLTGVDFLKYFIFWGIIFFSTVIGLMIYDKYGPGNFRNLLLGRYFHPKTEERIFMFLDIRSSTTIAEKLGDQKYFNFFHDFINDATEPILYTKGEIYQYIGDEIIVSWKMKNGLKNANCLACFFDIQNAIQNAKQRYLKQYGYVPEFKAGLHFGSVISGEIGVVKKEIAFSGDVLNTTSRIQNECNKHQLDLLLSDDLLNILSLPNKYQTKSIGTIQLRGKMEGINLSTVDLS